MPKFLAGEDIAQMDLNRGLMDYGMANRWQPQQPSPGMAAPGWGNFGFKGFGGFNPGAMYNPGIQGLFGR